MYPDASSCTHLNPGILWSESGLIFPTAFDKGLPAVGIPVSMPRLVVRPTWNAVWLAVGPWSPWMGISVVPSHALQSPSLQVGFQYQPDPVNGITNISFWEFSSEGGRANFLVVCVAG